MTFPISTIGVFHLLPGPTNRRRLGHGAMPLKHKGFPQKVFFLCFKFIYSSLRERLETRTTKKAESQRMCGEEKDKKVKNLEAMEEDQQDLRRLGRRGARRRKKKKWFLLFFVTLFPHILPVFFYLPPPMQFHSFSVVWKEVQKASPNPQDFYNLFFSCPEFVEIYMLRTTGIQC